VKIVETRGGIEIRSELRVGARALLLALSVFPLLAPYELILKPDWNSYLNAAFLFVALICLGAMTVSALLVWAAVAGLSSRMKFDKTLGIMAYSSGAPVVRWHTTHCLLREISDLRVVKTDWSEGSPSYSLVVHVTDGREFASGSSESREEVESVEAKISSLLGLST